MTNVQLRITNYELRMKQSVYWYSDELTADRLLLIAFPFVKNALDTGRAFSVECRGFFSCNLFIFKWLI